MLHAAITCQQVQYTTGQRRYFRVMVIITAFSGGNGWSVLTPARQVMMDLALVAIFPEAMGGVFSARTGIRQTLLRELLGFTPMKAMVKSTVYAPLLL
nr:hypothetical protein D3W47_20090 [Deinococcus sp. RM]